mmetsp:Transcript_22152/g.46616  ORF Transcript_22152/g.46616 Transcript_22152/m.46616 type:complete len:185 (+) Transcript_22152:780-1334(+)|eukprot:CAMPEP_0201118444 /NCGR_PEP_ID=MMETSP0850-20130426/2623_1 /ASSEMBLY_ACC=CAM_ASM_000622 /TAXON_ID=183588 /ORGANISM="Pseudo-nitzschia fraudulenta, Strain WWA7" /LENGTH=184 /DNA_ID=CAMNT_0047383665 /DNA_START=977 /DNA_END=1531 /DNA_ORIENTATION=+
MVIFTSPSSRRNREFLMMIWIAALSSATHGCMSPSPTNPSVCPSGASSCSSTVFGIPEAKLARKSAAASAVHGLRGGELHKPQTLDAVNSLVLKAGSANQLVVIDFTATWCGPCQMIAPIFEEMSNTFEDVVFMKVDVDDNAETAATYNVSAMPTFILIKGGVVVERVMGADPNKLMASINAHM